MIDGECCGGYSTEVLPGDHRLDYWCIVPGGRGPERFAPIRMKAGYRYNIQPASGQCNLHVRESVRDPRDDLKNDHSNPVIEEYLAGAFMNYNQVYFGAFVSNQKIKDNIQRNAAMERARAARELPMLTTIGTRICRNQDSFVYVGFVENLSGDKIQIRVADANVRGVAGVRPGGFRPEIIWDYPSNWKVCE